MTDFLPIVEPRSPSGPVAVPMLLLAGTVCDARLFAPMLALLEHPDARVLTMVGAETTPDLAAKILAGAPERFALLGFSLGGIVALEMIAQAPERIERLALIDTTPRPDPAANAAVRRAAVDRARSEGMVRYITDAWPNLVAPVNAGDRGLFQTIVAMADAAGPDVLASQSEVAIHRVDSRPRLGDIAVPTLVLAGVEERVCPLEAHREIADAIPGARLFTIPDAGHFAPLENPATVARHVRDWLALNPTSQTFRHSIKEPS